jgi:uncharacterized protein
MEHMLMRLIDSFAMTLGEMSPYLLFGFVAAGLLSVAISPETVRRQIGRPGMASVFKASLFGVPLPLCSCGVIPVGMSLRKHGAGRGAATAFLISTPQTGVDSFFVTFSLLGPLFAVLRPVVALVTGIAGGLLVDSFSGENGVSPESADVCADDCCNPENKHGKIYTASKFAFVTLPRDIGKFLLIGIGVAAVISAVVPMNYFSGSLGSGFAPMLLMMAIGIPMYVCSSASVPIAAALMATGISPGAALVFLMTGPATNAATITTIWKELGRRTAVIYLSTIAVGALASGFILDLLVKGATTAAIVKPPWEIPGYIKIACAVIILIMLAPALFHKKNKCSGDDCRTGADPDGGKPVEDRPPSKSDCSDPSCPHHRTLPPR